jgi:hypothetical protein
MYKWWLLRFRDIEREETREAKRSWIVPLAALGLLIIVAGIIAETYCEGKVSDVDALLRAHESDKITAAEGEAATATRDAGEANGRASEADLKRVALKNRILDTFGPRRMTSAQSAETTKKLLGLTGVQVDVFVVDFIDAPNSAEFKDSVSMGRSIQDTLNAANLDAEGWIVDSCVEGTGAQGLSVAVHFGSATMDEYVAGKILAAFPPALRFVNKVENFEPASYCKKFSGLIPTGRPNKRKPGTAKIMIVIGAKTQPLLTREMLEPEDEQKKP